METDPLPAPDATRTKYLEVQLPDDDSGSDYEPESGDEYDSESVSEVSESDPEEEEEEEEDEDDCGMV